MLNMSGIKKKLYLLYGNDIFIGWLIFALAIAVRLLYILQVDKVPMADSAEYHYYARNILSGKLYWGTSRGPLYPLFLAFVYFFYGFNYL